MTNNDTHSEAEAVLNDLLRQAPVWRKLRALGQLNEMAKTLASCNLRERHPQATEAELRRLLADRILGKELATAVYEPHSLPNPEEKPTAYG
ncbi:MAG TPA: hypothetical protein VLE70_08965 [Anaerolineae bacterium]|nr:hypothetical protein [Anaerolineae bacterium]